MKCRYPMKIKGSGAARPCGQCLPCRVNDRRVWTHRIILESLQWKQNAFVTLTFRDSDLPKCGVSVSEHQAFMKELRARYYEVSGQTIRFYMCGEYGDKTFRPHYHYALFNFPSCVGSGPVFSGRVYVPCQCEICRFVAGVWKKGHVFIGALELKSAQYIAGYVTKKMTKKDDSRLVKEEIDGDTGEVIYSTLNPEFSRSSRRPGIGGLSVASIVEVCQKEGFELPMALKYGNRYLPLGRYLRNKMYEISGQEPISLSALEARQMFSLLRDIKVYQKETGDKTKLGNFYSAAVGMQLVNSQRVLQVEQAFKRSDRYEI